MWNLTYPESLGLHTLKMAFSDATAPQSFNHTDFSAVIGSGEVCFRAAAYRLLSWRAHVAAGVGVDAAPAGEADVLVKFGSTTSPCKILCREFTGKRAVVVYGTLPGHVERGEEAFIVELHDDGSVTGRCVAFSRHAWWLARLGSPFARGTQKLITRRYVQGMQPTGDRSSFRKS